MVEDLNPGPDWGVTELVSDGTRLWFSGNDGVHGRELWTSDGTPEGAHMVVATAPGPGGPGPWQLTPWYGGLLYVGNDATHGQEPWFSDGSAEGTTMLADFDPGLATSRPRSFTPAGSRALFLTGLGQKLRRTNGTPEGTGFLLSASGERVQTAGDLVHVGGIGVLFARATDHELWKTNGWRGGTVRVEDIVPGPDGSYPFQITALRRGVALFSANDGVHGYELWTTNGTAAGTHLVKDINHP
jgi:ELWxxDGT repeat protein